MTTVPDPVSALLSAVEARDMATVQAAFTADAAIHDEGEVVHGPAGVERWHLAFEGDLVASLRITL